MFIISKFCFATLIFGNQKWEETEKEQIMLGSGQVKRRSFFCGDLKKEYAIALAMLYWAEGHKKECEFTNTDGRMIQFFSAHLRELFGLTSENIRVTARIFSGMKEMECVQYWSKITGVSKHRIVVYRNDGGSSGRTRYGICRLTIKKGSYILKVIHALVSQLIVKISSQDLERIVPALVAQRTRAASS